MPAEQKPEENFEAATDKNRPLGNVVEKLISPEANQQPQSDKEKKNVAKALMTIVLMAIVIIGIIVIYRSTQNRQDEVVEPSGSQQLQKLNITQDDIAADFQNRQRMEKSEVLPPIEMKERYLENINKSLEAIESGLPSEETFQDLREDYFNVAVSYGILGEYGAAEDYYTELLEKWPGDYKSILNLGDLYILMGLPQDAAKKFYEIIELYPTDYRVYGKLADLYVKYSKAGDNLAKADVIYQTGIINTLYKKPLYKDYAFFLENYRKDYERALAAEKEYQKMSGEVENEEIERLEQMIQENN